MKKGLLSFAFSLLILGSAQLVFADQTLKCLAKPR